jgi:hypothetical protein
VPSSATFAFEEKRCAAEFSKNEWGWQLITLEGVRRMELARKEQF